MSATGSASLNDILHTVVCDRVGIMRRIVERSGTPDVPDIFVAGGLTVPPHYFSGSHSLETDGIYASGAGITRVGALWAALGEGLERYSAALQFDEDLVWGSPDKLQIQIVDPCSFIAYCDEQYAKPEWPYPRQHRDIVRNWAEGRSLTDGRPVLLPAQQLFLGYVPRHADERIRQNISTGVSVAPSYDWALASALMEVIERDAFMTHWLLEVTPAPIELTTEDIAELPKQIVRILNLPDRSTTLRLLAMDHTIPTVLALMSAADGSQSVVGASTHPDLERAISKAVIEAAHGWVWGCELKRTLPPPAAADIIDFKHHVRYYLEPETQDALIFLKNDRAQIFPHLRYRRRWTHAEIVQHAISEMKAIGEEVYVYDHTQDDLRSLGMYAIRAVVPGLHPLSAGTKYTALDERRLRTVCRAWGREWPTRLNDAPHIFP